MPGLFGCGRSYLGFFLRGLLCLRARGGRQGAWLALKNVTMKGCLERGPRRPTRPTHAADNDRSVKTRYSLFFVNLDKMFVACCSRIQYRLIAKIKNSFSNFCETWSKNKTDKICNRSCGKIFNNIFNDWKHLTFVIHLADAFGFVSAMLYCLS